jgi:CRP-like cAMP-binding protein
MPWNPDGDWHIVANAMERPLDLAPLDRVGWLAEQPGDLRDWVAEVGRWRALAPGQVLYEAGDTGSGLYGLAEGSLDITFPLVGDEPVSIHRAEPGFWIGDLASLAETERLVSVHAGRCARILAVSGSAIRAHLVRHPEHWRCFYALTHRNMAVALGLLGEALALPPAARVARRLLQLADADGVVGGTQEQLAGLVGVTRTTVRRALKRLVTEGTIETGYRSLTIRRRDLLERSARSAEH